MQEKGLKNTLQIEREEQIMPDRIDHDNMIASQDALSEEEIFAIQFIVICKQNKIRDIEEICEVV